MEAEHIKPAIGQSEPWVGMPLKTKTHCEARGEISDHLWVGRPTTPIVREVCTKADRLQAYAECYHWKRLRPWVVWRTGPLLCICPCAPEEASSVAREAVLEVL